MADKNFSRVQAYEREVKILFAKVVVGASGAVASAKGASAVKESGDGSYTVTLPDSYDKILHVSLTLGGIADPDVYSHSVVIDGQSIEVQLFDESGAAADAAADVEISLCIHARNTSVQVGND